MKVRGSMCLIALIALMLVCRVQASTSEDYVRGLLLTAFSRLREAEKLGVNVTSEAHMLNDALSLIVKAEHEVSEAVKSQLLNNASKIIESALHSIEEKIANAPPINMKILGLIVGAIASVACCSLGYVYGSRLLWRSWLKVRRKWRVKRVVR